MLNILEASKFHHLLTVGVHKKYQYQQLSVGILVRGDQIMG